MARNTARERLEAALARIDDPKGEGARTCLTVYREQAKAAADAADARAKSGIPLGPVDGTIVSIKDLFDVAGEVTRAGSRIFAEERKPATADAPVVRRLRAGGAIIVAKTNMSEFAYTGIGANPHFGTPGNPADRKRVPGGSSSGAMVSAADGMCEIAIGSDTGGSCRIPAAICGIVGYKPSRQRIPTDGAFPLSYSIDSIGPIARTVEACAKADAVMAAEDFVQLEPAQLASLRIGIVQGLRWRISTRPCRSVSQGRSINCAKPVRVCARGERRRSSYATSDRWKTALTSRPVTRWSMDAAPSTSR